MQARLREPVRRKLPGPVADRYRRLHQDGMLAAQEVATRFIVLFLGTDLTGRILDVRRDGDVLGAALRRPGAGPQLHAAVPVLDAGAAVRALRGDVMVHAHTAGLHPRSLDDLAGSVGRMLAATEPGSRPAPFAVPAADVGAPATVSRLPLPAELEELLARAEDATRAGCSGVRRVTCTVTATTRLKTVVSTVTPGRTDAGGSLRLTVEVVADRAGVRRRAARAWGAHEQFELARHARLAERVATDAGESAERLLGQTDEAVRRFDRALVSTRRPAMPCGRAPPRAARVWRPSSRVATLMQCAASRGLARSPMRPAT